MRATDEQYLKTPFHGSRKMAEVFGVNRKLIGRLMRLMGIERLWRTVKYEEVYLKDYSMPWEAGASLASYFQFYCQDLIRVVL